VNELEGLTKRYRSRVAVDGLTVTVEAGRVTGFLAPNGSGTTTTMRRTPSAPATARPRSADPG
jgi:ABC-2 type transport system ATP-binding protein